MSQSIKEAYGKVGYNDCIRAALESGVLVDIPRHMWPPLIPGTCRAVWVSKGFILQVHDDQNAHGWSIRLSVTRTDMDVELKTSDGITWDDMQRLKSECGYGGAWATEIYPADGYVVNHANMRHLWVQAEKPHYAWGKDQK